LEGDGNIDSWGFVDEGVHVDFGGKTVAEEGENDFDPFHEMGEEEVFVVDVDFVNEFIEFFFVTRTEVDEGLYKFIGIGGKVYVSYIIFQDDTLVFCFLDDFDEIVYKVFKVYNTIVDIRGIVHFCKGFVEDGDHVSQKTCSNTFEDQRHHLLLVSLPRIQL